MCDHFVKTNEITKGNFERKFEEIERSLRGAQFVSIDVEFTGAPRKNFTWKLDGLNDLETPEKIYTNFKEDVNSFIIIQFGVTAFYFDSIAYKYDATCYTFYVFPQSLPSLQKIFGIHGAVMELLSSLDFNFNKVVYEGISYLNQVEEDNFKQELFTNSILGQTKRPLSMEDERIIQEQCSIISKWECTAKVGDSMELTNIDYSQKLVVYLLIQKIHTRFSSLWTHRIENDLDPGQPGVRIEKVSDLKRSELQSLSVKYEVYEKELVKHFVGISRIFKLLVLMKKPIVASGALFDMMMVYHHLHKPLPEKYTDFKTSLNDLFPHVYDAKHVAYEVRALCRLKDIPLDDKNGLAILDQYFRSGYGAELPEAHPAIRLSSYTDNAPATIGQDSGWDSYYTGCCFLRMAHFLAKENKYGCNSEKPVPMSLPMLFSVGVKQYKNQLHVAPATVDCIHLDGADPPPDKPRRLLLTPVSPLPIGIETMFDDLAPFVRGSVRFEMRGPRRARLTVNSREAALVLARRCLQGGDYALGNDVKEKAVKRTLVVGGVIGFSTILLWKMYRLLV